MSQNTNKQPPRVTTFRVYDGERLVRQLDGLPKPPVVYQFGPVLKREPVTQPGQVYQWAQDI